MNASERDPFLEAVDRVLVPLGFKRAKSRREWLRKVDGANTQWVQLNFGLGVINPSWGVHYTDLETRLPTEAGAISSVSEMMEPISKMPYSTDTFPGTLADHILKYAVPGLEQLTDRAKVVRRLTLDNGHHWPVFGAAMRMRLLPLLLAIEGRHEDALAWLSQFENAPAALDQIVPRYAVFAAHFRREFGG